MTSTEMHARLDFEALAPDFYKAMIRLDAAAAPDLETSLKELVRTRASQINGCAYCVDMHTKDARIAGETEQRLYALPVWRETPFFTERERAALAFTEAATVLSADGVPDDVYDDVAKHFTDAEAAQLISLVTAINAWNRISVSARSWTAGSYQP